MGCMKLSSSSCAEIGVPIDLRRMSQGISGIAQRKSSHLSCMMGNGGLLWSQCMELVVILSWFGLYGAISHSCGDISVLLDLLGISGGLPVVPSSKSRLNLPVWLGTRNCSARNAVEWGLISQWAGSLMAFLELWQEPGVCSWVTAWVAIKNFCSPREGDA